MTAKSFDVALCTVSIVVGKVCDSINTVLGPQYIKLPSTSNEMAELVRGKSGMEFLKDLAVWMGPIYIYFSQENPRMTTGATNKNIL